MNPSPIAITFIAVLSGAMLFTSCKPSASTAARNKVQAATPEPQVSANEVALRFSLARGSLVMGRYSEAAEKFGKLSLQKAAVQPLLNWITMHEGLAYLLAGKDPEARAAFAKVQERQWTDEGAGAKKLEKFFLTTTTLLVGDEKIPSDAAKDYDKSNHEAFALLLFGLKDWNLEDYENASSFFRQFSSSYMKASEQWLGTDQEIAKLKNLVDHFEEAFAEYLRVTKELDAAKTPEEKKAAVDRAKASRKIIKVLAKMTAELDTRIAEIEPGAMEAIAEKARMANDDAEFDAKALPEAKAKRDALLVQMRFEEAHEAILAPQLHTEKPREEQERLATRTQWLATFKSTLIDDINTKGYAKPVARKSGPPVEGGVIKADANQLQFRGKPAPAPLAWSEVAPDALQAMALSFIPDDLVPLLAAHRKWHLGSYLIYAGKIEQGKALATEASKLNAVFEDALPILLEQSPQP
ncbi:MAG: hypothetical protein JWL90_4559 [Chthoniobacteraceae bacterium]|nr:hypothetical protein [Chthoniobacteraceae bacterium]